MTREFGNGWPQFKNVLTAGAVFGVVMATFFGWYGIHEHRDNVWETVGCGFGIGLMIPLFVSPTLLFSIVIEDGAILHRLCHRWTLARKPLANLTQVDVGFSAGAKFHFADGSTISFMGAHLRILEQMCLYIRELRPEFTNFHIGSRAALLLKTMKMVNPKSDAAEAP